jgi:hypothetical protein
VPSWSRCSLGVIVAGLLAARAASAEPLIGAADRGGREAVLAERASGYERQQRNFCSAELGLPLPVTFKAPFMPPVRDFLAVAAADDFLTFEGIFPFEAIDRYEGYESMAFAGGLAGAGLAARLVASSAAERDRARAEAVRAAQTWHLLASAGGGGVIARAVRLQRARPGEPPPPGAPVFVSPLRDERGAPLPAKKSPTWRATVSGEDAYAWLDDAGVEHAAGWAIGVVWLWDALLADPLVPYEVTAPLEGDAAALGAALKTVAPELGVDLAMRDADGRLVSARGLNPRVRADGRVAATGEPLDALRAAVSLAVVRAAYHVSGDDALGRFYYEELVGRRGYAGALADGAAGVTDAASAAVLGVALATLARVETDGAVRGAIERALAASKRDTPWLQIVHAAFATSRAGDEAARLAEALSAAHAAPWFRKGGQDCMDREIQRGECALDPGVDFAAAYWLARALDADPARNLSRFARPALPYPRGVAPLPASPAPLERLDAAGGCSTAGAAAGEGTSLFFVLSLLALVARLRPSCGACRRDAGRASRRGPSAPLRR